MPRYLLSTRTIFEILQKKDRPSEIWLKAATKQKGVIARDVCISAVTPMAVRRVIETRIADAKAGKIDPKLSHDDLLQMQRNAEALFRDYAAQDCIVPISDEIASRWGELLEQELHYRDQAGESYAIGSVQKLEIATAIIGRNNIPFTYVERPEAAHQSLNGLQIADPSTPIGQVA